MNYLVTTLAEVVPPTLGITTDMLQPIQDSIVSNLGVILPVCIAIFGIMLGVKLVPKLIKHFVSKG